MKRPFIVTLAFWFYIFLITVHLPTKLSDFDIASTNSMLYFVVLISLIIGFVCLVRRWRWARFISGPVLAVYAVLKMDHNYSFIERFGYDSFILKVIIGSWFFYGFIFSIGLAILLSAKSKAYFSGFPHPA